MVTAAVKEEHSRKLVLEGHRTDDDADVDANDGKSRTHSHQSY
jgi:hypothetical protein